MLATVVFSFFYNILYPSKSRFCIKARFIFSSANALNLDKSRILLFGKKLTLDCVCGGGGSSRDHE